MYRKFFAIGLIISFIITGAFIGWQQIELNIQKEESAAEMQMAEEVLSDDSFDLSAEVPADGNAGSEPLLAGAEPEAGLESENAQSVETEPSTTTVAAITEPEDVDEEPQLQEPETGKKFENVISPEFIDIDKSYFEDALFIGDSRMVGIKEYGGLSEPTYFAGTGLSTFRLYKDELEVRGLGTVGFETVINSRSFGKIYIMLGINEAGSKLSEFKAQYSRILDEIKEKQPDALIFLCSNLHVTKYKSEHDSIFANSHIDEINDVIKSLAMRNGAYYLDVNPLFDDGEGNLSTDYAADYAHMYGRCYLTWIDWLCTKGIEVKKASYEQAY